jgi:hypothetical protein
METTMNSNGQLRTAAENALKKPTILIPDYKGFTIRTAKKGYLAFKGGFTLPTQATVQDAVNSVDAHFEWEVKRAAWAEEESARRAQEEREREQKVAEKKRAIFAVIQPVRDFAEIHGLDMLRDCIAQLEQEERERNVPENWEELVEICEQIGQKRGEEQWQTNVGDVDVDKYGVTEHLGYNSNMGAYCSKTEYSLQEYINTFKECWLED